MPSIKTGFQMTTNSTQDPFFSKLFKVEFNTYLTYILYTQFFSFTYDNEN